MILISLVGDQPIPNLLVARALQPNGVIWACSQRTQPIAQRISALLPGGVQALPCLCLPPYEIEAARQELEAALRMYAADDEVIFNLTGGTKPMAWAALALAAERNLPFVYLQTEGAHTVLYRYRLHEGRFHLEGRRNLPALINIEDYLRAHGLTAWHVKGGARDEFEALLEPLLRAMCDQVMTNLDFDAFEIDFVIRRGNKVGVIECKRGRQRDRNERRAGMDQLVIASEEKYLGTYTARFLVTDRPLSPNLEQMANMRNIQVVVLTSARRAEFRDLSRGDRQKLQQVIQKTLGS